VFDPIHVKAKNAEKTLLMRNVSATLAVSCSTAGQQKPCCQTRSLLTHATAVKICLGQKRSAQHARYEALQAQILQGTSQTKALASARAVASKQQLR
jgi:hypothetical protein